METLTLNGKEYVKASRAAKDLGYASDYVGQLCRSGSVDAHLVGRTWYVNPDTLGAHRIEKKRNSRVKAREYARKSIEASRTLSVSDSAKTYKNIAIRYQPDEGASIPQVKKVHIVTEKYVSPKPADTSSEPSYEVLNKDKKIIMSGSIPVFDAEEETALTDTVILSPKIVRTQKKFVAEKNVDGVANHVAVKVSQEAPRTIAIEKDVSTFSEKLAEIDILPGAFDTNRENLEQREEIEKSVTVLEAPASSVLGTTVLTVAVILMLLGVAGLFVDTQISYSNGILEENFNPTRDIIIDFILKYKDILSERY